MYQTIKMDILFIRNFDARNYTYWKDINKEQSCIKEIENPAITQSSNTVFTR